MIETFQYLAVFATGILFGKFGGKAFNRGKKEAGNSTPKTTNDQLCCGACKSPLIGDPSRVVVTATEAFQYYKCGQCGTLVTVPLGD